MKEYEGLFIIRPDLDDDGVEHVCERIEDLENSNEDCRFLDVEIQKDDRELSLQTVAQINPEYNPDREKKYDE